MITREELRASMYANGADQETVDRLAPLPKKRPKRTGPTPESMVIRDCLEYLKPRCRWVHRMNSGAYKDGTRFIRFGFEGCPDMQGQLHDGRIVFVECKSARGRTTPAQKKFMDVVQSPFVVAVVARSIDDLAGVIG